MRHPVESTLGTGIWTSFPSATLFSLTLGADLPWADCLYPGNLRFSADGNLTRLFVYSYLHSLFHPLQRRSRVAFAGPWNAPLPSVPEGTNPKLRYAA